MKKHLFFHIPAAALLLLQLTQAVGQTPWNAVNISSPQAKIITRKSPKFEVRLSTGFVAGSVAGTNIDMQTLWQSAFDPAVAGQLFEKLGGEFFVDNPSGQHEQSLALSGKLHTMPGLHLAFRPGRRVDISAGARHFRSEWSGTFPIVVFPQEPSQPKTLNGAVHISESGVILESGVTFFAATGTVQPWVRGGVRGIFTLKNESGAEIAGITIAPPAGRRENAVSPFGGAGLRLQFGRSVFVEAGCSYGKMPGGAHSAVVEAGVGCRF